MTSRRFLLSAIALALVAGAPARGAQDVSVTASLSRNVASAGEPVVLSIVVSGARNASVPDDIRVDGLDIRYAGQSTQIQMRNFDVTTNVSHNFQVVAQAPGKYTIPALRIVVGGDSYRTNPVTLTATQGQRAMPGALGRAPGAPSPAPDLSDIAYAELVVPKTTVYVGEAVPVELRFYFDSNVNFRASEAPALEGEGFTSAKFPEPRQERVTRGNRTFDMVTYETVITPVKAGELALGPARMQCVASIPRARQNLRHFGLDDFFNDDFFNNPMGAFAEQRDVLVRSDARKLEVKALPRENQPEGFAGAIGRFELRSEASPKTVNVGEPVTLRLRIEGRGNFDRMGDPAIPEAPGWRSYPPSSTFTAQDSLGLNGTKIFEYALIPNRNETRVPQAELSYFDPDAEKYVTLRSDATPVDVQGTPAATPAAPSRPASTGPAPSPTPAQEPAERDIHYILSGPANWGASFEPLFERRAFWLAQLVPLAALLGFIGLRVRQLRAGDVQARELAALRARRTECEKALRKDGTSAEFFAHAVQLIQLDTAIRTGAPPATVDARAALGAHAGDPELAERVREIFAARDERVYAGHHESAGVDPGERARTMETLNRFLKHG